MFQPPHAHKAEADADTNRAAGTRSTLMSNKSPPRSRATSTWILVENIPCQQKESGIFVKVVQPKKGRGKIIIQYRASHVPEIKKVLKTKEGSSQGTHQPAATGLVPDAAWHQCLANR